MRFAFAAIVAAGLAASPAVAQDTNEANTAVAAEPGTPADNAAQPVFPITGEANTVAPAPPPGGELVEQPTLQPAPEGRRRFPWGLLGLLGLFGLLGLLRRART